MKRKIEADLAAWHIRPDRKPLILRGARQVGKSTVVRQFARSQGVPLYEVNLEKYSRLDPIFAGFDIPRVLREIELAAGIEISREGKGILFLDEIQAAPNAMAALRYFHEDMAHLPVVAAGSLLEFAMATTTFSMPVGRVEYLHLGPMSFSEFLMALDEEQLVEVMEQFSPTDVFPAAAHDRLLARLRDFLLVGGMPEAVASLVSTGAFARAPAIHQGIINTYRDDFGKYASGGDLARLARVLEYSASSVGDKVKYVNVSPLWKSVDVRRAVDLLARAGVIHRVHHSDATGIPLGATADDRAFRLLFLDVGLMNAMSGAGAPGLEAFREKRFVNEGRMAEQYVGQHLLYAHPPYERPFLYYWLREGRKENAQVDYLLQCAGRIIPVEVKAGTSGSLKSLHQFVAARSCQVALRFDLNPPSLQHVEHIVQTSESPPVTVRFQLLSLPLYMAEQATRIVSTL